MRQALSALCSMLLLEFGLNKLYAQTGAFNAPSIRLLERVGFRQEGVLRQHHELNGVLWDDAIFSLRSKVIRRTQSGRRCRTMMVPDGQNHGIEWMNKGNDVSN